MVGSFLEMYEDEQRELQDEKNYFDWEKEEIRRSEENKRKLFEEKEKNKKIFEQI